MKNHRLGARNSEALGPANDKIESRRACRGKLNGAKLGGRRGPGGTILVLTKDLPNDVGQGPEIEAGAENA